VKCSNMLNKPIAVDGEKVDSSPERNGREWYDCQVHLDILSSVQKRREMNQAKRCRSTQSDQRKLWISRRSLDRSSLVVDRF
jgi:hypothetical protein